MSNAAALAQLLAVAAAGGRARLRGVHGAARGAVLARLARGLAAPLLCVTADEDGAERLAQDLAFFLGGAAGARLAPRVARLPADDRLPWDELLPDATIAADRLATLYHLVRGAPLAALVLSARALARRVVPPAVLDALAFELTPAWSRGRDALARALVESGYRHAPLVEDPGTFSLRGDRLDVFSPLRDEPVRLEFFGDAVEAMRSFDPQTQRSIEPVPSLAVVPARELFFSEHTKRAAEVAIRDAAEGQRVPSSKVRERLEQVREGSSAAGLEGLLPCFFEGGLASVFDYLPRWTGTGQAPLVYLDDPPALRAALDALAAEAQRSHDDAVRRGELTLPPEANLLAPEALAARLSALRVVEGSALELTAAALEGERTAERDGPALDAGGSPALQVATFRFGSTHALREALRAHHGEDGALAPLVERLRTWRDAGTTVVVACGSLGQQDRLARLLAERDVAVVRHAEPPHDVAALASVPPADDGASAQLVPAALSESLVDVESGLVVLTADDVFGAPAHRAPRRRRTSLESFVSDFRELKEGDLCVHADLGICRYAGLETMSVGGITGDFLVLHFAGRDKVYLPVSRLRLVSKFTGGHPERVALDRLGTPAWERRKAEVKEHLLKMAAELLQLYAARQAHPGFAFSAPDAYFRQFEADFEFDETVDQAKAIEDVLADMQRPTPMDRLVCGDVGYGKTEVALRAAFKAIVDRKQVAVMVPTTLLAHQHFQSFTRRFAGYPVVVDVVSGLRSAAEAREALRRAREGRVDILIGTHKLLGADVAFKDLGLVVIDEEQKFGVKQKEALRRLCATVDTLTLSATPIPRTLNLSMSGLRDLSLIATPPADRRAIRTFVARFDPALVKEAIERELERGGQVFVVHNRVQSIGAMERFLRELVPQARLGVAHGQMADGALERVMLDFVERRTQVLLATSIIESGLDIPSANTMIVNRADHFGLAQLYQLRGRIGRSRERAYAYLLLPQGRGVSRDALRRLEVLQSFTELGAGFSIATHDLELRGAGSLLGREQSGSIDAVGFELYTELLQEAVDELRGRPPSPTVDPEVNLPIAAYLPEAWIPDVHQRLVLYKRLAQCRSPDELAELRAELVDRYGDAPAELDALEEVLGLKLELRALGLRQLDGAPGRLVVTLGDQARLDGARLSALVQRSGGAYRLTPELKLVVRLEATGGGRALLAAARTVLAELRGCAAGGSPVQPRRRGAHRAGRPG